MPRKQTERKRRVHTRSRNGCVTCKAKHLRCDEQKPLCGRCLASGGSCGYVDKSTKHSHSPQPTSSDGTITPKLEELELWDEGLDVASMPQALSSMYAGEASQEYSPLLDIFSRYRCVVDREVSSNSHSFLVERALLHPALLHNALLLSALRWTWYSGSNENLRRSCTHHKVEAANFVNERLQDPILATDETTITCIAALAMAESGLGRPETTRAHIHGLCQTLSRRAPTPGGNGALLHNMVLCTTQGLSQMPMRQIYETTRSIEGCSATLTLFIEPEIQHMSEDPSIWDKSLSEAIVTSSYNERTNCIIPRSEAESRARFLQCCLKVINMLGPNNLDFFTLNWFIEALIDELSMSQNAMLAGNFPKQAWLWAAMMVRAAATSGRRQTVSESHQIDEWRNIAAEKIRLASDASNLRSWGDAEALLRTWVWHHSIQGAHDLKELWEEAVGQRKDTLEDPIVPLFLDETLCLPDEDRKPIIVDDEAFDLCVNSTWR